MFFAAVTLEMVVPFDPEYDPEAHPVGRKAVMDLRQEWEQGHFTPVWVYPRAGRYVLSDDYIILSAARHGEPDYLPCYVVGQPLYDGLEDIQTLSPDAVRRALGFA